MELTAELAEFLGMHAGDGYLRAGRKNEFEMSGSYEEKNYYDTIVVPLINKLFSVQIQTRYMPTKGTYGLSISKPTIKQTLLDAGFPEGAKSTHFSVPKTILSSDSIEVRRAFIRGVFDTDGCVRFDRRADHSSLFKRTYHWYPRIILSTVSLPFNKGLLRLLKKERYKFSVHIEIPKRGKENDRYIIQISGIKQCEKWFLEIGSHNSVKNSRYEIWKKYGFCPTKTTLEERGKLLKGETNPYSHYKGS